MSKNIGEFLSNRLEKKKLKNNKTKIIISHNRILEVDKIDTKEIKEGGKLNENENFMILDKDYGKSEELMRQLLEKKKKMPFGVFILLIILGAIASIIILVITYNIVISVITSKEEIINKTPIVGIEEKIPISVTTTKEEKEEKEEIGIKETQIIQNTIEFEKLKNDYESLQFAYNEELNKTCETKEIIKEVEKPLTQKEEFILNLGKEVLQKCDKILQNNINDEQAETCKNLYAKYILKIN